MLVDFYLCANSPYGAISASNSIHHICIRLGRKAIPLQSPLLAPTHTVSGLAHSSVQNVHPHCSQGRDKGTEQSWGYT